MKMKSNQEQFADLERIVDRAAKLSDIRNFLAYHVAIVWRIGDVVALHFGSVQMVSPTDTFDLWEDGSVSQMMDFERAVNFFHSYASAQPKKRAS